MGGATRVGRAWVGRAQSGRGEGPMLSSEWSQAASLCWLGTAVRAVHVPCVLAQSRLIAAFSTVFKPKVIVCTCI